MNTKYFPCRYLLLALCLYASLAYAAPKISILSDCVSGQSSREMAINNVRSVISANGVFWAKSRGKAYIVPKDIAAYTPSHFINGSLLMAGTDYGQNIHVVVSNQENDEDKNIWIPGKYDSYNPSFIDCQNWDRIFDVKGSDIRQHIKDFEVAKQTNQPFDCATIVEEIKYWPAYGNPYWKEKYNFDLPEGRMADFYDYDDDGMYNPCKGDFPCVVEGEYGEYHIPDDLAVNFVSINPSSSEMFQHVDFHMTSYTFGFNTHDEANDVLFYKNRLAYIGASDLTDAYFGFWVMASIGCNEDDRVGCLPDQNLIFQYNADNEDGKPGTCSGVAAYSNGILPMTGLSFEPRIRAPKVFSYDQNNNRILIDPESGTGDFDTLVELGMHAFIPGFPMQGDDKNIKIYNILKGLRPDGIPFYHTDNQMNIEVIRYFYPSWPNDENGWSPCTENKEVEPCTYTSFGPLLLQPGSVNEFNFFPIFQRESELCPSLETMLTYQHHLRQKLDARHEGGTLVAPLLEAVEVGNTFQFTINPKPYGFIGLEDFAEQAILPDFVTGVDSLYRFEGYQVWQVKELYERELYDPQKAVLIYQTDLSNDISKIYNWKGFVNPLPSAEQSRTWLPTLMVDGKNEGIDHHFSVDKDYFTGGPLLKNTTYHYVIKAYAHNNYKEIDIKTGVGQRECYMASFNRYLSVTPKYTVNTNTIPNGIILQNKWLLLSNLAAGQTIKIYDTLGRTHKTVDGNQMEAPMLEVEMPIAGLNLVSIYENKRVIRTFVVFVP